VRVFYVEGAAAGIGRVQGGIEDALALLTVMKEDTLLSALRRLTMMAPSILRAYVLGGELVIAVEEYPLLQVDIEEGRVKVWEDWKNRLGMAAKKIAEGLTRRTMALLLDRSEELAPNHREELRSLLTALSKADVDELAPLLRELRTLLDRVEPAARRG